jgi:molybdate transport system substrate-binding protein
VPTTLRVLSAGAAQGLIEKLGPGFTDETGVALDVTFGPVGVTRDALVGGSLCDVVIISDSFAAQLARSGHLAGKPEVALGKVHTGLCTRVGTTAPKISTPDEVAESLLAADEICIADPERATAGIHISRVLHQLGIEERVRDRLSVHPNGAAVVRAVAGSVAAPRVLGCAQVTEIIANARVDLVGPLPDALDLATTYTASMSAHAEHPDLALAFITLLTGPDASSARRDAGFLTA